MVSESSPRWMSSIRRPFSVRSMSISLWMLSFWRMLPSALTAADLTCHLSSSSIASTASLLDGSLISPSASSAAMRVTASPSSSTSRSCGTAAFDLSRASALRLAMRSVSSFSLSISTTGSTAKSCPMRPRTSHAAALWSLFL